MDNLDSVGRDQSRESRRVVEIVNICERSWDSPALIPNAKNCPGCHLRTLLKWDVKKDCTERDPLFPALMDDALVDQDDALVDQGEKGPSRVRAIDVDDVFRGV